MSDYRTRLMEQRKKNSEKIREQVSILDIAQEYGMHIKKHGFGKFSLEEHPSTVIYPETNTFCYFSGSNGGDVFNFLEIFEECGNLSFNEAYKVLLNKIDPTIELTQTQKHARKEKIDSLKSNQMKSISLRKQLSNIDSNNKNVMAYLIRERKIDPTVVYEMLDKNLIKQQTNFMGSKNVVFLGYDEMGMLASAQYRGCSSSSTARGDFADCNYDYGWLYSPKVNNSAFCPEHDWSLPLVCTEGFISMMAFVSLIKSQEILNDKYTIPSEIQFKGVESYKNFNYHACGSVTKKKTILKLQEKFNIKEFIIGFDNDEKGIKASNDLKELLEDRGCTVHQMYSLYKDWDNDRQESAKGLSLNQRITNAEASQKLQSHKDITIKHHER